MRPREQARFVRRLTGLIMLVLWLGVLLSISVWADPDKKVVLETLPTEEELQAMIDENNEKTIVIHIKTENEDKIKEKIKNISGTWYSWTLENKTTDHKWVTYFDEAEGIYLSYLNAEEFLAQTGSNNAMIKVKVK